MQVYVGWRLGEAGDIWFVWRHYEAPMPLPTPRARDCESLSLPALRLPPFSNFVDDLFCAWSSFLCGKENLTKIWSLCPVGLGDWSISLKCLMTWSAEMTGKTSAEFKVLISWNLLELILIHDTSLREVFVVLDEGLYIFYIPYTTEAHDSSYHPPTQIIPFSCLAGGPLWLPFFHFKTGSVFPGMWLGGHRKGRVCGWKYEC